MDASALRWTLGIIGIVLLVGIYLYGVHQSRLRKRAAMETFTREEIDSAFIEDEQLRDELDNLNLVMNDADPLGNLEAITINPALEANLSASSLPCPDLFIADVVGNIEAERMISYLLKHPDHRLITGEEIINAVNHVGLSINTNEYLEYRDFEEVQFTLASLSEPGHFAELDQLEFNTLGFICFIDLDAVSDAKRSYEIMLKKIDELVRILNVKVYQASQDLLTISEITQVRKRLKS